MYDVMVWCTESYVCVNPSATNYSITQNEDASHFLPWTNERKRGKNYREFLCFFYVLLFCFGTTRNEIDQPNRIHIHNNTKFVRKCNKFMMQKNGSI